MEMKPNKVNLILSLIFFLMFAPFIKLEGKFVTLGIYFAHGLPKPDYVSFFLLALSLISCYILACLFVYIYKASMSGKLFKS